MIKVDGVSLTLEEAEAKLQLNPFSPEYFCESVISFGEIPNVDSIMIGYKSDVIELSSGEITSFGYEFSTTKKVVVFSTSLGTFKCTREDLLEIPQAMPQDKVTNFVWKKNFILFPHQIQKQCCEVFDTEDLIHQVFWNLRVLKTLGNEGLLASAMGRISRIGRKSVEFDNDQFDSIRSRKLSLFNYTRNLSFRLKDFAKDNEVIKALVESREYVTQYESLVNGFSINWRSHLKFLMLRSLAKCALLEASYESQSPIQDSKDLVFSFSDKLMLANIQVDSWKFNKVLNSAPDLESIATKRDVELSTIKLLHYLEMCYLNGVPIDDDLGEYHIGFWWNL